MRFSLSTARMGTDHLHLLFHHPSRHRTLRRAADADGDHPGVDARALDDFERHRQRLAIGGHHRVAGLHLRQVTHFVADLDGERLAVLALQGERPVF